MQLMSLPILAANGPCSSGACQMAMLDMYRRPSLIPVWHLAVHATLVFLVSVPGRTVYKSSQSEPKRYCGGCGGAFCGTHAVHVESFNGRYCEDCRAQLAEAQAMGVIANRKDSAYPQSRRTSVVGLSSAPGSRRPSLGGSRPGSRSASRTPSRTPSRSVSRAGSRRPSISMAPATSTVPAPSPLAPKLP